MSCKFLILIFTLLGLVLGLECWLINHNEKSADEKQCVKGPVYWCANLRNSKTCKATKHCIQTVWTYENVAKDNDSICKICTDMVGQARDVLQSNSTNELIKEVIDGSCHLIPLPVITEECLKLGDAYIVDLVDTLASMMNPDQVCTVVGLCNNHGIDVMLMNYEKAPLDENLETDPVTEQPVKQVDKDTATNPSTECEFTCDECKSVTALIAGKFRVTKSDKMLQTLLYWCGEFSSYSDACSSIVLTYFDNFYKSMEATLDSRYICDLSGACSSNFHKHSDDNVETNTDCVRYKVNDEDIPCKLCSQLVLHLREVLIANTTKDEFKYMLKAVCKQTNNFKDECLKIVDDYYTLIYTYLLENLNAEKMCYMIGICPKSEAKYGNDFSGVIRPMLPVVEPQKIDVTITKLLGRNEPKFTPEEVNAMQLPIERLTAISEFATLNNEKGEICIMCEYILHFVQETLSTTKSEAEIKHVFATACDKIAYNFHDKCRQFVEVYAEALTSMLIEYLNPKYICPDLGLCHPRVTSNKPTCPLCYFAMQEAEQKLKKPKTKESITKVLENLCSHMLKSLKEECQDFVDTYTTELISMLIKDMPPEAICVQLKLCNPKDKYLQEMGISFEGDNTVDCTTANVNALEDIDYQKALPVIILMKRNNCQLCQEFVKNVEKDVINAKRDNMKKALYHICDGGYESNNIGIYGKKCRNVVAMILDNYAPKKICEEISYCLPSEQLDLDIDEAVKYDVSVMPGDVSKVGSDEGQQLTVSQPMDTESMTPMCLVCDLVMQKLQMVLKKDSTREEIESAVKTVCKAMPSKKLEGDCDRFMEKYENQVIKMLMTLSPSDICGLLGVCVMPQTKIVSDEVSSCGVCQSATSALLPYLKEHEKSPMKTSDMINAACKAMRRNYYKKCSELIKIYGISILNLSDRENMTASRICYEIGKCTKPGNGPYVGYTVVISSNSVD